MGLVWSSAGKTMTMKTNFLYRPADPTSLIMKKMASENILKTGLNLVQFEKVIIHKTHSK